MRALNEAVDGFLTSTPASVVVHQTPHAYSALALNTVFACAPPCFPPAVCTSSSAAADVGVSAELESSNVSSDRLAIKAFREYVAADKQGRALELLDCMNLRQSMEGEPRVEFTQHELASLV